MSELYFVSLASEVLSVIGVIYGICLLLFFPFILIGKLNETIKLLEKIVKRGE